MQGIVAAWGQSVNLHEFQSKKLFAGYGIPVPFGYAVDSAKEARRAAEDMGGGQWVVKAQAHTGGRGKAGGVKLVKTKDEIRDFAHHWLGRNLVTYQTDENGQPVGKVLVESCTDIAEELYLGAVVDRSSRRIVFMASTEGGVEIEEVAAESPEKIIKVAIDPVTGFMPFHGRELAFGLGLEGNAVKKAVAFMLGLYRCIIERDASLVEINPLVVTGDGHLVALDAKMSFDDNALFRHQEISELRDMSQEHPVEARAADRGLSYVSLEGNIGCKINGAGRAMATMDMIKLKGGAPANFLDIGGGASPDRVLTAFRTVLADPKVEAILVNIFAGINRCDWIAEGVVQAFTKAEIKVPVVVRLSGTNVEQGKQILADSKLPIATADTLAEAAEKAVAAVAARQAA